MKQFLNMDHELLDLRAQLRASESEVARLTRELEDARKLDEWAIGGRTWRSWNAPGFGICALQLAGSGMKFEERDAAAARRAAVEYLEKEKSDG